MQTHPQGGRTFLNNNSCQDGFDFETRIFDYANGTEDKLKIIRVICVFSLYFTILVLTFSKKYNLNILFLEFALARF